MEEDGVIARQEEAHFTEDDYSAAVIPGTHQNFNYRDEDAKYVADVLLTQIRNVWSTQDPANQHDARGAPLLTEPQPKAALNCSFDMSDPGCVRRNTVYTETLMLPDGGVGQPRQFIRQTKCDWYRIRVDAEHGNIANCRGRLLSITRAGTQLLAGEMPILPFAPGEQPDAAAKTIHEGVPEYLDVLAIFENNHVIVALYRGLGSSSINWNQIFSLAGDYTIKVAITSPDAARATIDLMFMWRQDRATAQIVSQSQRLDTIEEPPQVLQIEVGEIGPFFSTTGGLYDIKRTFNIKISNVHNHTDSPGAC
jgi:hypothetical protein